MSTLWALVLYGVMEIWSLENLLFVQDGPSNMGQISENMLYVQDVPSYTRWNMLRPDMEMEYWRFLLTLVFQFSVFFSAGCLAGHFTHLLFFFLCLNLSTWLTNTYNSYKLLFSPLLLLFLRSFFNIICSVNDGRPVQTVRPCKVVSTHNGRL